MRLAGLLAGALVGVVLGGAIISDHVLPLRGVMLPERGQRVLHLQF
jgi:hypothetical protein